MKIQRIILEDERKPMHKLSFMLATVVLSVGVNTLPATAQDANELTDPVNQGNFSFSLGADITSAYFFRGYLQEDEGFIFQPWAEFGVAVVDAVDNSPGVSLTFGNWNSFHSEKTGATEDNVRSWYESDFYGGVGLEWDTFSLGATYTAYTYPNSDFNTVQELGVTAGFSLPDESVFKKVLGDISVGVHVEVDNSNVNSDEAIYAEVGFGPGFDIFDEKATMSIPVTFGFSLDNYYVDSDGDDDLFGYASVGVDVAIPLESGSYGGWCRGWWETRLTIMNTLRRTFSEKSGNQRSSAFTTR